MKYYSYLLIVLWNQLSVGKHSFITEYYKLICAITSELSFGVNPNPNTLFPKQTTSG